MVISSEMPELLGLADRILVMAGGRVVGGAAAREASEERILGLAMADNLTQTARRRRNDGAENRSASAATDVPAGRTGLGGAIERVGTHNFSLLIALAALIAIFGILRPDVFFLLRNILNIGQAIAILGMLATAQTIVIISGGLDISVGAVVGCRRSASRSRSDGPLACPSILFGLVVGASPALVNGLIITFGRVNAVIATLGTMAAFRGVAFIISDGSRSASSPRLPLHRRRQDPRLAGHDLGSRRRRRDLLRADALHNHRPQHLRHRRQPDRRAPRRPQLNGYQIGIYILSGATAAWRDPARRPTGSGQPISGSEGLELEAITAAVLGGCALKGGKGTSPARCSASRSSASSTMA